MQPTTLRHSCFALGQDADEGAHLSVGSEPEGTFIRDCSIGQIEWIPAGIALFVAARSSVSWPGRRFSNERLQNTQDPGLMVLRFPLRKPIHASRIPATPMTLAGMLFFRAITRQRNVKPTPTECWRANERPPGDDIHSTFAGTEHYRARRAGTISPRILCQGACERNAPGCGRGPIRPSDDPALEKHIPVWGCALAGLPSSSGCFWQAPSRISSYGDRRRFW